MLALASCPACRDAQKRQLDCKDLQRRRPGRLCYANLLKLGTEESGGDLGIPSVMDGQSLLSAPPLPPAD
jgi:hypothetical protein